MGERKYSVSEIDQMRRAVENVCSLRRSAFDQDGIRRDAEDQLRTYMLAGTEPDELQRFANEAVTKWLAEHRPHQERP